MVKKPIFKNFYSKEKENPESRKDFERLIIQNILRELKENSLINAEEFSASLNLLYNKPEI